jgi:hypothetical protein
MTPDERSILQSFLSDLINTPAAGKDPEADAMIQDAVQRNPSAVYLLVQHAILSDQALHAAQAQLMAQREPPTSFLAPQASPWAGASQTSPWAGPSGAPVQSSPFGANSGLGGFLRNAGQMAAGVAAGDLLSEGISNLFGSRW